MANKNNRIEIEITANADKATSGVKKICKEVDNLKKTTSGGIGLDEISKEIKDFGTTTQTSKTGIGEISEKIGGVKSAASGLSQKIMAMDSVWKRFGVAGREANKTISTEINKLGEDIKNKLVRATTPFKKSLLGLVDSATSSFYVIGAKASDAFKKAAQNATLAFAGASVAQPFVLIGQKVTEMVDRAKTKISDLKQRIAEAFTPKNLSKFAASVDELAAKMSTFGSSIMQTKSLWTDLAAEGSRVFEPFKAAGATILQPLVGTIRTIGETATKTFSAIVKGIEAGVTSGNALRGVLTGVGGVLSTLLTAAAKVAVSIGRVLVGAFKKLMDAAKSVIKYIASIPGRIKESITNAIENLKNKINELGQSVKDWYNNSFLTQPLRNAAEAAGNFASKLANVGSGLARIAYYRGIRTIIKEIGQAFRDGINNLYGWSQAINGEFAASMDRMATSLLYLKNSIAAAVAPLINALAPAIDFVVDKIVEFLNVINQLFARLTGKSTWTKAVRQATTFGDAIADSGSAASDSVSDIAEAAEEALRYLAPFDELNVLPDNTTKDTGKNKTPSSGDSGAGALNEYAGMFEEVMDISEDIKDFADRIREAIEASDWQGLGELLGGKVNEIVDSIQWAELGEKFGKGMNAIISTKYWTFDTINFTNIGAKIATFLNSAIDTMLQRDEGTGMNTFETWGRSIVQNMLSAIDAAFGFVFGDEDDSGINTRNIGKAINNFLSGVFAEFTEWFQGKEWNNIGHELYEKGKDLFAGLDFAEIASNFFKTLGTALGSAASALGAFFGDLGADIKTWFDKNLKGQTWSETAENILKWIGNGFKNIATWVDTNFIQPFMNALGAGEWWENLKTVGANIWDKIATGWPDLADWVQTNIITPIKTGLTTGDWSGVMGTGNGDSILANIKAGFGDLSAWAITNIVNPIGRAIVGDSWNDLNPSAGENLLTGFQKGLSNIGSWAKTNIIDPIVKELEQYDWSGLFSSLISGAKEAISKAWHESTVGAITDTVIDVATYSPAVVGLETITTGFSNIGSFLQNLFHIEPAFALDTENAEAIGIDVTATVTGFEDEIPDAEKIVDDFAATIENPVDEIPSADKKLDGFGATIRQKWDELKERTLNNFGAKIEKKDDTGLKDRSISGFTAKIKDKLDELKDRTIGNITAKFTSGKDSIKASDKTISKMKADFTDKKDSINEKTLGGFKATITDKTDKIKSKTLNNFQAKLTSGQDSISNKTLENFKAKLTTKQDSLSDKTLDGFKAKVTTQKDDVPQSNKYIDKFLVKFTDWKLAFSQQPTANVQAVFNKWKDSLSGVWSNAEARFNTWKDKLSGVWSSVEARFNSWKQISGGGALFGVWSYATAWFNGWHHTAGGGALSDVWSYATAWFNGWHHVAGGGALYGVWAYATAWFNSYQTAFSTTPTIDVRANVVGTTNAGGGVYSNGSWKPITQFASGGFARTAQLFVAREAGPELVGTLKGHTAVMNNDQIVASVSAGVARAIAGISFHMEGLGSPVSTYDQGEDTEEAMYRAVRRVMSEIGITGDINVNVDLDSEPVYRGVVRRNEQNRRMTGVNQLAMA